MPENDSGQNQNESQNSQNEANENFQKEFLNSLGINTESLSAEEQSDIFGMINDQLQNVVMETTLENMSPEQTERFKKALDDGGENIEAEMESISSEIPGLQQKIEQAVAAELDTIKAARAQLN
jgi:hypothetical protein